ncbi:MAG: hypothetical protein H7256_14305 [Bdellovibrio sp.]|nr:hypothetical protein [Bdellovibrio sp.]
MTQKTTTVLAMAFVIVASVLVNELVLKATSSDKDRDVASFGERFEPSQIKWEQELASSISKDDKAKTVLATKPNLQDRLLFQILEGRYEAQALNGKIHKFSLLPNQSPLEINTTDFMKEYSAVSKDFDIYDVEATNASTDSVKLKKKSGEVVGNLVINRDDKGRVIAIEVQ